MDIVGYLIDSIYYRLSFTGALICLFGCCDIFVDLIELMFFCDFVPCFVHLFESFDMT